MTPSLRMASIILLTFFSISCSHPTDDGIVRGRKAASALMDSVEYLMDDYPEYADSMMQRIDSHSICNKKQRARYALLSTATHYKTYQPFTNDSLISEAVQYFSTSKNLDYRFLSYYYLGCVYMEIDKMTDASKAYAQAEYMVDKIDNDYWKGLLYSQLGLLFNLAIDYNRAEDYYIKSDYCFRQAGKKLHSLHALFNLSWTYSNKAEYDKADSVLCTLENNSILLEDSILYKDWLYKRLSCYVYWNNIDSATRLLNEYDLYVENTSSFGYLIMMARYLNSINDYEKSVFFLDKAMKCYLSVSDSVYLYYESYKLAKNKGQLDKSLDYLQKYSSIQDSDVRNTLMKPILGAQYDIYRTVAELEMIKSRNKTTILISSFTVFFLMVLTLYIIGRYKKREADNRMRDYISTINELTTQISINQDKISNLNSRVREMLRQQFDSSDYLYTRFYEQIDDNKKAERIYRVVKKQLEDFTTSKYICRIDELLDEAFEGIMSRLSSADLDIKEKDLLLLRFVLAGFSAKSIAAILGETHLNISQRKKRMLDKIQLKSPKLMEELRIALNSK